MMEPITLTLHVPHKIGAIFTKRVVNNEQPFIGGKLQFFVVEVQVISCKKTKYNRWKTEVIVLKRKGMR